mmetsp:Transcript_3368/g.9705  ORF Transcript_3368/g.9705 Transcript_3368/m.9705 type:complete len:236 (-) Transcript_3368:92-799(-)
MKIRLPLLQRLHLDPRHMLLNARGFSLMQRFFHELDVRNMDSLDDVAFTAFMQVATDLRESQILKIFDMFDVDGSGSIEFDEFFLLVCIMIAIKDGEEKQFLARHSRTCFELLDEDGSQTLTVSEFETFGFVFGFSRSLTKSVVKEFDFDGSRELDYDEFRMFCLACIDREAERKSSGHLHRSNELLHFRAWELLRVWWLGVSALLGRLGSATAALRPRWQRPAVTRHRGQEAAR